MKMKLCFLVAILILVNRPVFAGTTTYTLNPFCTSWPTYNDTGDLIGSYPSNQAHFAFDLSSIPNSADIVSATFSAYLYNMASFGSQRNLWYNSDDSWIDQISTTDPGESVAADEIVGTLWHDDSSSSGYVWKSILINYDGWADELADGDDFISLILTSGQYGAVGLTPGNTGYNWGVLSEPELTLVVMHTPAPGAVLLGGIGISIISWLRRRKQLM